MNLPSSLRLICMLASLGDSHAAERIVFDVDLTTGSASGGIVTGGTWDNGWKTSGAKDERIVFDAGAPIANGFFEVTFTADSIPWSATARKLNFAGLHEDTSLNQNRHSGDLFYARTGNAAYNFACVKVAGRRFDRSEAEPRLGRREDWVCDARTPMTIRFEWRDGVPLFTLPNGMTHVFSRDQIGGDTPIDQLRYAFLGSDGYSETSVRGLRFLRAKLVDLGPDANGPEPTPLRVSENGRRLVDPNGRPVFLLADTAWGLANHVTREEAEAYLRLRRAQRFNAVTFVAFTTGNADISPSIANAYGALPFVEREGRPDPTQPLVTPGRNPGDREQYDYWDHLDYLIATARRLGLYVILLPSWGSSVVGSMDGKNSRHVLFTDDSARTYGRWLAERYRDEPHVIWMLGGDRAAVIGDFDFRPRFRAMAEGIREVTTTHFLSYHPKKNGEQSGASFHNEPWLSFNSIQEWPDVQLRRVAEDWARVPPKPTWLFEGRYEGYWKNNYRPEDWGGWQMRQQAWQTVFEGAFGHTYGHERVFGFGSDGTDWRQHLRTPGSESMTHLARLMNCLQPYDLLALEPAHDLVDGERGETLRTTSSWIGAVKTPNGRKALFYSASGRPVRVRMDLLVEGPKFAWWFNPRTGGWHADGRETSEQRFFARDVPSGSGRKVHEFKAPTEGPGHDWILIISVSEGI